MSVGSTASVVFSDRRKQLLQAMGYTVWQFKPRMADQHCLTLELDCETLASPVVSAMLAFVGLDVEQARRHEQAGGRLLLCWQAPGTALVLPPASALRHAAGKRSVWPALRALRRSLAL
ncbi:MAG: hypothetical protein COW59_12245 [Lysobacterales bacterium CG17_big_fil_post_rev_8_21_14_2_50_64_11]|nr:MAG: hypothetical protein COW59_12245 [Xanthomonadales bacterium CG17_big_fil_post_rev_8_21_14_2_50_64_11]PIX60412.1 MAG: hypothetical protein COZ47_07340 [Xanthomonadales bacterium CG_4_10_14_3_um_filter_64_11]